MTKNNSTLPSIQASGEACRRRVLSPDISTADVQHAGGLDLHPFPLGLVPGVPARVRPLSLGEERW